MIYWINGSYGVGKTTIAEALVKKILVENGYDIDELGFTIKELLKYGFN